MMHNHTRVLQESFKILADNRPNLARVRNKWLKNRNTRDDLLITSTIDTFLLV